MTALAAAEMALQHPHVLLIALKLASDSNARQRLCSLGGWINADEHEDM